eukprot:1161110-Pelagomonas_calceolata.AAC.10
MEWNFKAPSLLITPSQFATRSCARLHEIHAGACIQHSHSQCRAVLTKRLFCPHALIIAGYSYRCAHMQEPVYSTRMVDAERPQLNIVTVNAQGFGGRIFVAESGVLGQMLRCCVCQR